jgi:hypothetical protein
MRVSWGVLQGHAGLGSRGLKRQVCGLVRFDDIP